MCLSLSLTSYFFREILTLEPFVPNLTFGTIGFCPILIVPILKVRQFFLFDRLEPLVYWQALTFVCHQEISRCTPPSFVWQTNNTDWEQSPSWPHIVALTTVLQKQHILLSAFTLLHLSYPAGMAEVLLEREVMQVCRACWTEPVL